MPILVSIGNGFLKLIDDGKDPNDPAGYQFLDSQSAPPQVMQELMQEMKNVAQGILEGAAGPPKGQLQTLPKPGQPPRPQPVIQPGQLEPSIGSDMVRYSREEMAQAGPRLAGPDGIPRMDALGQTQNFPSMGGMAGAVGHSRNTRGMMAEGPVPGPPMQGPMDMPPQSMPREFGGPTEEQNQGYMRRGY